MKNKRTNLKKLKLLLFILFIGLNLKGQLKEVDIKSTDIYKSSSGWSLHLSEYDSVMKYTIFYRDASFTQIVVTDYETIGSNDDVIEFFECVLLVMLDKEKKFQSDKFYISHQNKSAAYVGVSKKNNHFYIRKKEAQKVLEILNN